MYKQKNKNRLEKSKHIVYRIKRKLILILTAMMLGMSNGINEQDNTVYGNQHHIEQKDKKD